ncbi:MBL fold metallo-hydrolase [Enterovirga sp.]|uniref:MBL fold metallo-hydrolase n=1 Tax=Enterovirga sp. TaxID=2026350 RepID=UPI0026243441|nr:MBL fold metallo-hydrolase [Enterovirga sp.]MDB5592810.1 fold metallo-hydrolase [Enterovirga sp.]
MSSSSISHDVIVAGSSLRLDPDILGVSTCALVHTPEGPILFDAGSHTSRESLKRGLAERNLKPADIRRVFLSHLHFDHVMNIDLFPFTTEVFVSRTEWDYVEAPHPEDDWLPWGIREQLQKYQLRLIDGHGELSTGLRYFPAPGHTPGCYALAFTDADGARVTIAGDAIKFPREAVLGRVDHAFAPKEVASRTIREIVEMSDVIVPGHFPTLRKENGTIVWDDVQRITLISR